MNNKNINISFLRIIAMCFILFCHIANQTTGVIKLTAHFFDCGIFIFFLISAFLYSNKTYKDKKSWFIKKLIQLNIPIYVFIFILFIINLLLKNDINVYKYIYAYILNIEAFINNRPLGLEHLWYITITIIFYFLNITILNKEKNFIKKALIIELALSFILSYTVQKLGLYMMYVFIYTSLYYFFKYHNKSIKKITSIAIFVIAVIIRITTMKFIDGNTIYVNYAVPITHTMIAFSIFSYIQYIQFRKFGEYKLISFFSKLTYYVYIVHYMFIVGPIRIYDTISNYYLASIIVVIISFICAALLMKISDKMIKFFDESFTNKKLTWRSQ